MAATTTTTSTMGSTSEEELQREIDRLSRELDEASHEKIQAAQYGLQVLEEKHLLQTRLDELEGLYDSTKQELECVKEALCQFQLQHKQVAKHGVQHEESLLAETATRESFFHQQITTLEQELRQTKQELSRTKAELEKLQTVNSDATNMANEVENHNRSLKEEIRELKHREQRLANDYSELEEENISLLKQVSALKSGQLDLDSMKYEVERLMAEMEVLQFQMEESEKLKQIAEKQIEEALTSLHQEREQRLAMKKELDQLKNSEHMVSSLNSLANSVFGMVSIDESAATDPSVLKELETSFHLSSCEERSDLFSEIHGTRLKQLEAQYDALYKEKQSVDGRLSEIERKFSDIKLLSEAKLNEICGILYEEEECRKTDANLKADTKSGSGFEEKFDNVINVIREIVHSSRRLTEAADESKAGNEAEMENIQNDLRDTVFKAVRLQCLLCQFQGSLVSNSEKLAQIYHHLCTMYGKTPDRVMLDHMKGGNGNENEKGGTGDLAFSFMPDGAPDETRESSTESDAAVDSSLPEKIWSKMKEQLKSDFASQLVPVSQERGRSEGLVQVRLIKRNIVIVSFNYNVVGLIFFKFERIASRLR
ncbi:unnamed protein product [Soboliphyme baturini]|uniref:GRIP domain-containing protein n=1 Tax=Soboliphyme baturini TaxID=241478 RepID=A0A183IP35_9BILA|nr:unnamed protein product [Soboliphyme baturini]